MLMSSIFSQVGVKSYPPSLSIHYLFSFRHGQQLTNLVMLAIVHFGNSFLRGNVTDELNTNHINLNSSYYYSDATTKIVFIGINYIILTP
jgi:hypothetical protein